MSVQTREITKTIKANVLVCDGCEVVGPETEPWDREVGRSTHWIYLKADDTAGSYSEPQTFCSWRCVANYADDKQSATVAETVGAA